MIATIEHGVARVVASLFLANLSMASARADYLLQPGDVLEISVAGIADLKQKSVVGLDGEVSLPMIRLLKVGGLDLAAAQKLIREQLSQKLYQQRTSDGREGITAIAPDAVLVTIAEYRPVYLNGDITKPGEQAYRPGMTVRQAVALAGGYEIMRFRMQNPFLETADLRNEFQNQWMQYVKQQAKIWRINAQLAPKNQGAQIKALDSLTQAPLPAEALNAIRANAREQLDLANSRLQTERAFLQRAVVVADEQITLLRSRQGKDDENVQVDTADYNKLKEFSERGNVAMTRLSESRRLYLYSATQSLQTTVQLTNTIRERDEAQRKIGRLDESNRAELLKDLEDATVELDSARSRLKAVSEKITYTGMIRSQLTRGGGAQPTIRIIRSGTSGSSEAATEDTRVQPGDTIEVALHTEMPEGVK